MIGVPMRGESVVSDIDLQAKTWKIPSRRMKGNVPHKIGLEWLILLSQGTESQSRG
jgi:hypothetical protein